MHTCAMLYIVSKNLYTVREKEREREREREEGERARGTMTKR